jgi:uncharacterized membrane protein
MMFFVGGLSGLYLGMINENQAINKNVNIFWQSIIGAIVILLIELISGIILNLWLHMGIWDYSTLPCNVLGQICLPFAFGWLLLCPFGFWLDDMIRSYLYKDKIAPYTIKQIYARAWNPFDKPFI